MLFLHMQIHERMAPSPFRFIDSLKTSLKPPAGSAATDLSSTNSLSQQAPRKRERRRRQPPKDPFGDMKEMEKKHAREEVVEGVVQHSMQRSVKGLAHLHTPLKAACM